jgi:hypothetical protein
MTIRETDVIGIETVGMDEAPSVSWAAVIAGAVAAVATTLVLMLVGAGLGLSVVSPWANAGVTATTFAISSVVWLVVIQWLSSAAGGYLAGRLRRKWSDISADEATFRDTAHGFLAWALASIVVAALLGSAISAITGAATSAVTSVGSAAVQGAAQGATQAAGSGALDPTSYYVDSLFRQAPAEGAQPSAATPPEGAAALPEGTATVPDAGAPSTPDTAVVPPSPSQSSGSAGGAAIATREPASADLRAETGRILATSLVGEGITDADKGYLAQLVSQQTGLTAAEAEARVNDVIAQVDAAKAKAKEAADQARKAGATLSLLMALALVIGAFIASVAAALGGQGQIADRRIP